MPALLRSMTGKSSVLARVFSFHPKAIVPFMVLFPRSSNH